MGHRWHPPAGTRASRHPYEAAKRARRNQADRMIGNTKWAVSLIEITIEIACKMGGRQRGIRPRYGASGHELARTARGSLPGEPRLGGSRAHVNHTPPLSAPAGFAVLQTALI